jgi:acetyltransferase-like isoleucine patch superfamily enzyme
MRLSFLLYQYRMSAMRLMSRALIAFGGHSMKLKLLRKAGVKIGENCRIYTDSFGSEPYLISIGNHCTITSGVVFVNHDGACWVFREQVPNLQNFGPIVIKDNSFIGTNAILLPHLTIGPNSIVAAGAVVTKDVPPNTVVGGVPARVLMSLDEYRTKMMARPEATAVPTDPRTRRTYLERRFRETLERA